MSRENMVEIPAGRFRMGSNEFYPEEAPAREVEVSGFAIDRGPVTVAQFARFIEESNYLTLAERVPDAASYPDADPSLLREGSVVFHPTPGPVPLNDPGRWWAYLPGANWRHPWGPDSENSERGDHPVTHVAFEDAQAYASWVGKQLPSEAEWEYAARGGLEGAVFAWGNEEQPDGELMANFWQGEFPWRNTGAKQWRGTSPVGLFPANGYGLYDVTGNVWEWTSDYYAAHSHSTQDPSSEATPNRSKATPSSPEAAPSSSKAAPSSPETAPSSPETAPSPCCQPPLSPRMETPDASYDFGRPGANIPRRVIKGGSHLCAPSYCLRYRPAARQPEAIDTSTSHLGFRCIIRGDS